ncbi:hypothetical protein MNBD_GAMMA16-1069 [hydrothermal vent metagenome]|uniref:STAS domain-containing protein n=1 Tax=hydrothermal vent metagenome TaxID=652676 RepID=A0A3B0Z5S7_9ZZZZ
MKAKPVLEAKEGEPGCYRLLGEISFATVGEFDRRMDPKLFAYSVISIDLAGVSRADSAGLALLLAWVKIARSQSAELSLENFPNQLLAIARVGGVDDLLPISSLSGV